MTTVAAPPVRPAAVAGRISYAVLFTIGLPGLLAWWAIELDEWLPLPPYRSPRAGSVLALAGLALMVSAMRDLWVHGLGLPASPFPPQRLVTSGLYRFVRDPIYIGAVAAAFGWSLFAGSPAGLWIVRTPVDIALYTHYLRRLGEVDAETALRNRKRASEMSVSEAVARGLHGG